MPIFKGSGIFYALLDALLQGPETVSFPACPLTLPEGFRGAIVMPDPEACSGCGLCVRDCPAAALVLDKEDRETFRLVHYPGRCAYCGQCEDNCRRGAISHTHTLVGTTQDPQEMVVLKDTQDERKKG
jgi:formate hydrogenlyase subunit 6/NADH:ubiquinone oxidoreductase subunit I